VTSRFDQFATGRRQPSTLIRPKADRAFPARRPWRSSAGILSKPIPCETASCGLPAIHAACPSRQGQGGCASGSANSVAPVDRGPLAGAGTERHLPAPTAKPGAWRKMGQGTSARVVGCGTVMERLIRRPGKHMPPAARCAGDLRWWPERRLRSHPDHSRGYVAFVADRLLLRSTPVGVRSAKIQENSISVFLFAGQALSFPQAGPLKVRPAVCGK
jgi:hypothetical protein